MSDTLWGPVWSGMLMSANEMIDTIKLVHLEGEVSWIVIEQGKHPKKLPFEDVLSILDDAQNKKIEVEQLAHYPGFVGFYVDGRTYLPAWSDPDYVETRSRLAAWQFWDDEVSMFHERMLKMLPVGMTMEDLKHFALA